jgi:hypothetical protein
MAVPALGAFLLDLTGLTLRTGNVLAVCALLLIAICALILSFSQREKGLAPASQPRSGSLSPWEPLRGPRGRARVRVWLRSSLPLLLVFVLVWLIGLRLAWPSMLPVSTSVDEVNHWLLVDYLVRHGALPHGDEARSLVEMAEYPFGAHLPIALAARWLGFASPYLLHPFATLYLALLAAFAYALVAELGHRWVALVAVPVLLWPAAYTLGAIAHDFFLAQLFGVACLVAAAYWATARRRIGQAALPPLVLSGVGLLFSYPSLLPIYGAGVALALLRPPTRRGLLAVAAVGAPLALLAAAYLLPRLGTGLDVVRQGGVATAPTLSTLPPLFVLLGLAGLLRASRRCAPLWPLAAFGWVALAQTALFGLLVRVGRELSPYAVEKMLYVLAPLLAVLGAALLVEVLRRAHVTLSAAKGPSGSRRILRRSA